MAPNNNNTPNNNNWINGARNWARWQDYNHDRYNAAQAIRAWYDLPSWTFEHIYNLLTLALEENLIQHESESARDDSTYYARRLARIEKEMTETAGRIE